MGRMWVPDACCWSNSCEPTALEQIHVDTRNRLFLEDEDDLTAVARGVDRHNLAVRADCR